MKYRVKVKGNMFIPQYKFLFWWCGWEHDYFRTIPNYYNNMEDAQAYINREIEMEQL